MNPFQNRHPVDRLADLRTEISRLKGEEAKLRKMLLADGADLEGSEYSARIDVSSRSILDRQALVAKFGPDAVAACCKNKTAKILRVVPLPHRHGGEGTVGDRRT